MDHRRNIDIKASLNIQEVQKLEIRRLRYFGHVCQLDSHRLPYIALLLARGSGRTEM